MKMHILAEQVESVALDVDDVVEDEHNVHAVVFHALRDDIAQVKELVRRGRVILHRMFLGIQVVHQTGSSLFFQSMECF
jgi:hypothetical protein